MPCGSSIKHDVYITAFMVFFFYHVRHFLSVFDHLVLVFYSDFTQVNGRIHPSILFHLANSYTGYFI